jgi:AcrR family transcriptional regulator
LPQRSQVVLEPRKSPVQARSAASVEAILQATIQVLLSVGKERLTTTRVALRAGVSVGTLYQYFPNKSALLQAALQRHLLDVRDVVELVCKQQEGAPLRQMVTALITAFLQAKMRDAKASVALYAVSSDLDAAKIVRQMGTRFHQVIVQMLATSSEPLTTDPKLVASILQGAMLGVSRTILESGSPEKQVDALRRELIVVACAYMDACSTRVFAAGADAIGVRV